MVAVLVVVASAVIRRVVAVVAGRVVLSRSIGVDISSAPVLHQIDNPRRDQAVVRDRAPHDERCVFPEAHAGVHVVEVGLHRDDFRPEFVQLDRKSVV